MMDSSIQRKRKILNQVKTKTLKGIIKLIGHNRKIKAMTSKMMINHSMKSKTNQERMIITTTIRVIVGHSLMSI